MYLLKVLKNKSRSFNIFIISFLVANIAFPYANVLIPQNSGLGRVISKASGLVYATGGYSGGQCDARSKGYFKNHDGCHNGSGSSTWAANVRQLSSQQYSNAFSTISGSQICTQLTSNCGGNATGIARELCRANQFTLTDELNIVSGRLQPQALIAGAVNSNAAFNRLGLTEQSTVAQAMAIFETIITNPNHSEQQLSDVAFAAERIYTFYESENPQRPQCVLAPSCGNAVREGAEQCDRRDGVGAHQRCTNDCRLESITFCGNGSLENPNGENQHEQCDDGNTVNYDGCDSRCRIEPYCRMELVKTDSADPVAPGAELTYTLRLTNTGTGYCTGGGVKLREYYDEQTTFVSSYPAASISNNEWNFGEVPPGEINEVQVKVRVDNGLANGEQLSNRACFWTREYDRWVCTDETTTILTASCGDGVRNGDEQCDGTDGVGDHQRCTGSCTLENRSYCGDGIAQSPNDEGGDEQCDGTDGVGENQACTAQCTLICVDYCGDGVRNGDEQCDGTDGVGDHQRCTGSCTLENRSYCGDGIAQSPNDEGGVEQCDGTDGVPTGYMCSATCQRARVEYTDICGVKFNDRNENGLQDNGEEALSGWTIQLYKLQRNSGFIETLRSNFTSLWRTDEDEELNAGRIVIDQNRDCWEHRDSQWHYACGGSHYTLVDTRVTDSNGYCFNSLDAGTYYLTEVPQDGWRSVISSCTLITDGVSNYQCNIANVEIPTEPVCGDGAVESPEQCDDGNTVSGDGCSQQCIQEEERGSVCGVKFNDADHDGIRDDTEESLSGWTIELYQPRIIPLSQFNEIRSSLPDTNSPQHSALAQNLTGCWEESNGFMEYTCTNPGGFEKIDEAVTEENGYCFRNLPSNTYRVVEVQKENWIASVPECTVTINGNAAACDIGNYPKPDLPRGQFTLAKNRIGSGVVRDGDQVTFELVLVNTGTVPLTQASLIDTFDAERFAFATSSPAQSSVATSTLIWDDVPFLPLEPGESSTTTVSFTVKSGVAPATIINRAATSGVHDQNGYTLADQEATASVSVEKPDTPVITTPSGGGGGGGGGGGYITPNPIITIDKTVSKKIVEAGETLTYTVSIKNVGNTAGMNLTLDDELPSYLAFADGSGAKKHWDLPPIAAGSTQVVEYNVIVTRETPTGNYINRAVAAISNGNRAEDAESIQVLHPIVLGESTEEPAFIELPDTSGAPLSGFMSLLSIVFNTIAAAAFITYIRIRYAEQTYSQ